jgi:hypothetical protein
MTPEVEYTDEGTEPLPDRESSFWFAPDSPTVSEETSTSPQETAEETFDSGVGQSQPPATGAAPGERDANDTAPRTPPRFDAREDTFTGQPSAQATPQAEALSLSLPGLSAPAFPRLSAATTATPTPPENATPEGYEYGYEFGRPNNRRRRQRFPELSPGAGALSPSSGASTDARGDFTDFRDPLSGDVLDTERGVDDSLAGAPPQF